MGNTSLRFSIGITAAGSILAFVSGLGQAGGGVPGVSQVTTSVQAPIASCVPNVVGFDIVYVRAPRYGDDRNSSWPDTTRPMHPDAGADLRLLHPDCTEEVLFPLAPHQAMVDAPLGNGSVSDPNVSFDGQTLVFAYYHDQTAINGQRGVSRRGADVYRLDLRTRETRRLTSQTFTPNTGNGADFDCSRPYSNCPQIGVFNIGPAFFATADEQRPGVVFTSTRNGFQAPKPFGSHGHVLQLFTMDFDGRNVAEIGYLNQSTALHPAQLADGRLMFTSWENQGIRDNRQFNLWFIGPDGTQWSSGSGFGENTIGHHFMTQMSNGDIAVVRYYNLNNNGFGDLVRFPLDPAGPDFLPIRQPGSYMPFQRPGQVDLTRWSQGPWDLSGDSPAPCALGQPIYPNVQCPGGNSSRVGKVTHPAAAPGDDLLLVYTPGAANHSGIATSVGLTKPYYDGGLYLMPRAFTQSGAATPADLKLILNDPSFNEQWPRPVVPFSTLFPGQAQPRVWPELANPGQPEHGLPPNTPFGLIGSSSLIWRDTDPRPGQYGGDPDPFNASHEFLSAWARQGADAGTYSADDIYAVRLLALLPATDRRYPNGGPGFASHASERMRILGEIPVRHQGVIDGTGNTDTSFLARVPADTPFTFQTLDRNGMVLNMAQTWHQVRPGEARYDCGGCHAHTKAPLDFDTTVAGQPGFQPTDVAIQTPLLQIAQIGGSPTTVLTNASQATVEYTRDVKPILAQRCSGCHQDDVSDGKLNLHADATPAVCSGISRPGTYYRLALDAGSNSAPGCRFGLGTPTGTASYFLEPQKTRYVRAFQSRESLLIWKVFGARLDGRTNATRTGDIDYDPAADSVHPKLDTLRGLSWDEKLTLARWVDLGAPTETAKTWGWFEDDLRPTLWVSPTLADAAAGPIHGIVVGAYDLESGLAPGSLSVSLDIPLGALPPGTNLAQGAEVANGSVVTVSLPQAIDLASTAAVLTVAIRDNAGHKTEVVRSFAPGLSPRTPNAAPEGVITQPATGTLYAAGDTIVFTGSASDPEDGTLPAWAFTWRVDLVDGTRALPVVPATNGLRSGSFTIPTTGAMAPNAVYRIQLTVRDSGGLTHTSSRLVQPRTATLTLATAPPGLQVLLDGQPVATPYTFTSVAGNVRQVEAPPSQAMDGKAWTFASWSDAGARAHNLATPSSDTSYIATYSLPVVVNTAPLGGITQPLAGALYRAGDTVVYAGAATDPEDGVLSGSALTWRVDLMDGSNSQPVVPPTSGAVPGSFRIPTTGPLSPGAFYRIQLTATDSGGLTHTTSLDVHLQVATISLSTTPAGLALMLDGQAVTTPYAFKSVVGSVRRIEALPAQSLDGRTWAFNSWSDGGALAHGVATPSSSKTYAAKYFLARAHIVNPKPGSQLPASTVTFTWSRGTGVSAYRLDLGTTRGGTEIQAGSPLTTLSTTVTGLPANAGPLFARLWSQLGAAWEFVDASYTTVSPAAKMISPTPGSQLASSTVTFSWSAGLGVTTYSLSVGTKPRSSDIFQGSTTNRWTSVPGLPVNGKGVYVRLTSQVGGATFYNDYIYKAASR